MGVDGQRHAPAALPPGMTRYPLYRRLGMPQGRSGRVLKISLPPGFKPRTVQLVASRYTYTLSRFVIWPYTKIYRENTKVVRNGTVQLSPYYICI